LNCERPLEHRFRFRELAFVKPESAVIEKTRRNVDVILTQQPVSRCESFLEQWLGLIEQSEAIINAAESIHQARLHQWLRRQIPCDAGRPAIEDFPRCNRASLRACRIGDAEQVH